MKRISSLDCPRGRARRSAIKENMMRARRARGGGTSGGGFWRYLLVIARFCALGDSWSKSLLLSWTSLQCTRRFVAIVDARCRDLPASIAQRELFCVQKGLVGVNAGRDLIVKLRLGDEGWGSVFLLLSLPGVIDVDGRAIARAAVVSPKGTICDCVYSF